MTALTLHLHLHRRLAQLAVTLALALTRAGVGRRDERGDVPGWVLVAVMSAGLVGVLGAVAGNELGDLLRRALNSVG